MKNPDSLFDYNANLPRRNKKPGNKKKYKKYNPKARIPGPQEEVRIYDGKGNLIETIPSTIKPSIQELPRAYRKTAKTTK